MAIAIAKQEDREKTGCEKVILTRMYDVGPRYPSFEKGETTRRSICMNSLEDSNKMSG